MDLPDILIQAIEHTADHIMITDTDGRILYVNAAFETTTGYSREEVVGKDPKILQSGKHGKEYYELLWKTILAGEVFYAITTNKNKSGEFYIADQSITPLKNKSGEITHFISVWKDITEKVRLENLLKLERQKLFDIINFDQEISTLNDDDIHQAIVNKTAAVMKADKVMYFTVDEKKSKLILRGVLGYGKNYAEGFTVDMSDSFVGNVAISEIPMHVENVGEHPYLTLEGLPDYLTDSFIIIPVMDDNKLEGVMLVTKKNDKDLQSVNFDEVDLKILNLIADGAAIGIKNAGSFTQLRDLTDTDPMTHIHNFRYFQRVLNEELKRAKRFMRPFCVMMIDIDKFKDYNDTHGHLAGDELLKQVSRTLNKNLREIDILCRYGGDEFVALLPEADLPDAITVAERLRSKIEELDMKQPVTLSIGVSKFTKGMDKKSLLEATDKALYQSKKNGRNKVSSN